jgi:hypothetical protein
MARASGLRVGGVASIATMTRLRLRARRAAIPADGTSPMVDEFPPWPTRKSPITPGWAFVHIGFDHDDVEVRGLIPWKHPWSSLRKTIIVAHPSYPRQRHRMWVHAIKRAGEVVTFAAGEFSNGVWGFYVPTSDDAPIDWPPGLTLSSPKPPRRRRPLGTRAERFAT